ncbi:MAG: ABC transporter ATP-binding protein, partial [Candidatus Korobacteraceae bacterium]
LEALAEFNGTVVFVSHDRYFIDKLATRVFEIADGEVRVFPGNYEDYLWRKQQQADSGTKPESAVTSASSAASVIGNGNGQPSVDADGAAEKRRINPIKLRQMQQRCQELEEEVARVEAEVRDYEDGLGTFVSAQETARITGLLHQRRMDMERLMAEWEELSRTLESAEV